jgi:hypothetical protein
MYRTDIPPKSYIKNTVYVSAVDSDPIGSETLSRIRIWEKIIPDPGSSGSEMNLK